MMYAIKAPSGFLLIDTTAPSRARAYDLLYDRHLHGSTHWYGDFPKRCRRLGYRCVTVIVQEVPKS